MQVTERFYLPTDFVRELAQRPEPWGFGAFSEMVYYTRYSRLKENGQQERWIDTVTRNINGAMSILKTQHKFIGKPWDEAYWQHRAKCMAEGFYDLKWSPPGRGMWMQGTEYIYSRGSDALNNCAYVSVRNLAQDASWLMDKLMKGVGVGFSTHHYRGTIRRPSGDGGVYVIPDSREGWCESVHKLITAYTGGDEGLPTFDYSHIRGPGEPIRGFGGVSSGPGPLKELHERLTAVLERACDGHIDNTRLVADVMNLVGRCVIAGNVRRSAEIALGRPDDNTFLNLKNYGRFDFNVNPTEPIHPGPGWERREWAGYSNNSIVLHGASDVDYLDDMRDGIALNGEPGFINQHAISNMGRAGENQIDMAEGINPCGEIPLESYEMCNLVIVYPTRCPRTTDLTLAVDDALLYAMAVSMLPSEEPLTNEVVSRNHRIGVGVTGLADWVDKDKAPGREGAILMNLYTEMSNQSRKYARYFRIPEPVRLSTVKPDGTASLIAGVSPGVHWPWAPYVLRRVRQSKDSKASQYLIEQGVPYEDAYHEPGTVIFEFPLMYGGGKTRSQNDVSAIEQLMTVQMMQKTWADNSVSATITFGPDEVDAMINYIKKNIGDFKALSFLPKADGTYPQAPYEAISEEEYNDKFSRMGSINWQGFHGSDGALDYYCDTDTCSIV